MNKLRTLGTYAIGAGFLVASLRVDRCLDSQGGIEADQAIVLADGDVSQIQDIVSPQVKNILDSESLFELRMQRRIELMPNSSRAVLLETDLPIMEAILNQGMSSTEALNTFGPLEGRQVFDFMMRLNEQSYIYTAAVSFLCDLSTYEELSLIYSQVEEYPNWVFGDQGIPREYYYFF